MQDISKLEIDKMEDVVLIDNEAKEFRQIVKANFEIRFGYRLRSLNIDLN